MAEAARHLPTYTLGEKINLELEASDKSGVDEVAVVFRNEQETGKQITLQGSGNGQTEAVVVLEKEVTGDMAPGQYQCFYIALTDVVGNRRTIGADNLRFRIEGVPGDHEGPRLHKWQLISPEGVPSEEVFGETTIEQEPPT